MMGDEPRAELGMSMEKRIFGGPFKLLPLDTALEYTQSSHPFKRPFAISQLDFPYSPEYGEGGFHINQEHNNFPQSESAKEIGETVKSFYNKALDDFDDRKRIYKALRPWYDAECNTTPNIPSPLPLGDKLTHRR